MLLNGPPDSTTTKKLFRFISSAAGSAKSFQVSLLSTAVIGYQFQFILSGIIYTAIQLRLYVLALQ
jgi:hypothetical protein